MLWGILLMFLSGSCLAITLKKIDAGAVYKFFAKPDSYKKVLLIILALAVFTVLLDELGFIFSALLLLIFLFRAIEPQKMDINILNGFCDNDFQGLYFSILSDVNGSSKVCSWRLHASPQQTPVVLTYR